MTLDHWPWPVTRYGGNESSKMTHDDRYSDERKRTVVDRRVYPASGASDGRRMDSCGHGDSLPCPSCPHCHCNSSSTLRWHVDILHQHSTCRLSVDWMEHSACRWYPKVEHLSVTWCLYCSAFRSRKTAYFQMHPKVEQHFQLFDTFKMF